MYKIQLNNFEGPIDLLLYFIRRDELDIYDIPIAKITKEFIDAVEEWERVQLHVAGDFIVMASTLMRIKAKLLLPRPELGDDGEIIDPRKELVQQLVEYKRFKDVAEMLKNLSDERDQKFCRQLEPIILTDELDSEENIILDVTLYDLARFFKSVMDNMPVVSQFELHREPVRLEKQKEFIFRYIDGDGRLKFSTILDKLKTRMEIVVTFLAVLDLVREGICRLTQNKVFGDLELQKIGSEHN
ncbi:MAG: segregation/condensation protein A [Candidatus Neomarinimicrobiota bacterium]|jgi:segregation and condensation protein A|nr:segregation/condensation protein A [Candidatus Neomarinimicrobiota bacterium]